MAELPHRPLGASGIEVSCLALGSWRTYERMSREDGLAVMRAARESGIDFLDDARYNDETGNAPMPTGYSEVVFGELFRAARWERDRVTVANKLWWEFWPEQSAADELDASLGRMGLDHVDLIYTEPPPAGLELADLVEQVVGLIASGKARAWGMLNWTPDQIARGLNPPRVLVTEHLRQRHARRLHQPIDRVQIGGADARAAHPHEHLVGAGELRRGVIHQL